MQFPQTGGCPGGCLCGAVRYVLTAAPALIYTCHCTACQKITASAFSLALLVAAEACRFSGGETRSFTRTADSGREVTRWVCAACGGWVCNGAKPGTAPAGTLFALRAATLDDTSWLRPDVHFWTSRAQPWIAFPRGDTRFDTQPEDGAAWLRARSAGGAGSDSG
ncbi:MAG: GFA family protein [Rhodospirillales bacterium]|nr:GFA family protein [Rhodospirillales bacterium]